jgi:hypothetical protein
MPINKENIKKALDAFEADDFTTSKEIIQKEIAGRKAEWMQEKLGLEKPIGEDSSTSYAPPKKDEKDAKDKKDKKDSEEEEE